MKLLTRIVGGLGRSGGGGGLISPRFHFHLSCRHMVTTVTHRREREPSGPAPAADDPAHWMILNRRGCLSDCSAANVVADAKTAAESRTSWGLPLRVSLSRAAPPAISFICFDRAGGDRTSSEDNDKNKSSDDDDDDNDSVHVLAGHGDSVLLKVTVPYKLRRRLGIDPMAADHFVYRTAAAGRPPSLSPLPTCRHIPMYARYEYSDGTTASACRTERELFQQDTGILRRGSEVLVAQLQFVSEFPFDTAELCVLRPGRGDWELKEAVPIAHHEDAGGHDLGTCWPVINAAVPAGDRFLCWVDYNHSTFLVCDMAKEDNPELRYVPLPVKEVPRKEEGDEEEEQFRWQYYRTIGGAPPDSKAPAVRFVSIDNRCCCGAPLRRSPCEHSSSAFMVTKWRMALNTTGEPMEWVKECVLDCKELWAMLAAGDEDIPCVYVTCPVVSSENPDVVCFLAEDIDGEKNRKLWALEVDMRRKKLLSVVPCPPHPHQNRRVDYCNHLPANIHS